MAPTPCPVRSLDCPTWTNYFTWWAQSFWVFKKFSWQKSRLQFRNTGSTGVGKKRLFLLFFISKWLISVPLGGGGVQESSCRTDGMYICTSIFILLTSDKFLQFWEKYDSCKKDIYCRSFECLIYIFLFESKGLGFKYVNVTMQYISVFGMYECKQNFAYLSQVGLVLIGAVCFTYVS